VEFADRAWDTSPLPHGARDLIVPAFENMPEMKGVFSEMSPEELRRLRSVALQEVASALPR